MIWNFHWNFNYLDGNTNFSLEIPIKRKLADKKEFSKIPGFAANSTNVGIKVYVRTIRKWQENAITYKSQVVHSKHVQCNGSFSDQLWSMLGDLLIGGCFASRAEDIYLIKSCKVDTTLTHLVILWREREDKMFRDWGIIILLLSREFLVFLQSRVHQGFFLVQKEPLGNVCAHK